MQEITKQGARQMIVRLNQLASRLSDLISEENARRQNPPVAVDDFSDHAERSTPAPAQFTDEQRSAYSTAVRELEHIRNGRPQADNLRAQEAYDRAVDELSAGIAALTPQEAQAGA